NFYYDQFQNLEEEDWEGIKMDSKDELGQELFNRIQNSIEIKNLPIRSFKSTLLKVAAVLLIASVSIVLYNQYTKKESAPSSELAARSAGDIMPGSNKAILTLSDGRQVILDDMDNGAIINQGDLAITKSSD